MKRITLEAAMVVVAAAFAKGRELGLKPLCVAVVDAGGHVLAVHRDERASILRPQVATGKALGALGLGVSSRAIADMAADRPTFVAALAAMSPGGIVPAAGGVLILDEEGWTIGAVGVTGDTSDNDELCAIAGIAAGTAIGL